jgi:Ran GTPase-activating protein (RanGAP) involved in mRNA processing and transport
MASSLDTNKIVKRCLLIGNNDYKEGKRYEYSLNNVNDLEQKLSKLDFKITIGRDLTSDEMDLIIENFIKEIDVNDLILFYYCGYAINYNNENYLIPIDNQQIEDPKMFAFRTINVKTIIHMINDRRPSGSIYLFDSSRSYLILDKINLKNSIDYGGLCPIECLTNNLIMFSCEANKIIVDKSPNGRNTLFVFYILQYIDQINLSIDEIMDIISDEIINETDHRISPFKISFLRKNLFFNYQIQTEISQRRSLLIEDIIKNCQNGSLVDLRNKQLIDRDLKIIIQEIFIKKQFTRLWLDGNHLTPIGASILSSALINNNTLERLYLSGNSISDIGIKYLSKALSNSNKTLKILGLQQNQITDLGIEHLSQMIEKNTTLISLSLDFNLFTDKGVKILINSLINSKSSIQFIGLSNNKFITDVSCDYLINLIQFNPTINEICLYHCSLSKSTKEKIRKISRLKKNFSIYLNNWNE